MAAGEDLYHLDRGAFADIDPTLVVTQDLCAVCAVDVTEVDDAIAWLGCSAEVLTLDPGTLDEVIDSVLTVGAATGTSARAEEIVASCRRRLAAVAAAVDGARRRPTLVLEWTEPAFTAGHWVPDLVTAAGGEAVLGRPGAKSVGVDWSDVASCGAEVVIVSPCGFRLDGAADAGRRRGRRRRAPPGAEVWAVDADAFVVRPGPRVVEGVETFAAILHPDRCGPPDPDRGPPHRLTGSGSAGGKVGLAAGRVEGEETAGAGEVDVSRPARAAGTPGTTSTPAATGCRPSSQPVERRGADRARTATPAVDPVLVGVQPPPGRVLRSTSALARITAVPRPSSPSKPPIEPTGWFGDTPTTNGSSTA